MDCPFSQLPCIPTPYRKHPSVHLFQFTFLFYHPHYLSRLGPSLQPPTEKNFHHFPATVFPPFIPLCHYSLLLPQTPNFLNLYHSSIFRVPNIPSSSVLLPLVFTSLSTLLFSLHCNPFLYHRLPSFHAFLLILILILTFFSASFPSIVISSFPFFVSFSHPFLHLFTFLTLSFHFLRFLSLSFIFFSFFIFFTISFPFHPYSDSLTLFLALRSSFPPYPPPLLILSLSLHSTLIPFPSIPFLFRPFKSLLSLLSCLTPTPLPFLFHSYSDPSTLFLASVPPFRLTNTSSFFLFHYFPLYCHLFLSYSDPSTLFPVPFPPFRLTTTSSFFLFPFLPLC